MPNMTNMLKGAIFDLDGTLLDSMPVWQTLGDRWLRSVGLEPKPELGRALARLSIREAAGYFREEYGVPLSEDEIVSGINALVARFYREDAPLKPGVSDFLGRLQGLGVKMCIATATDRALAEAALARCGVLGCFSEIFTCDIYGGKSSPDIYRAALDFLGTGRGGTLVFEDTLHTLSTAKADGFLAAGVYDPNERRREEFIRAADVYIESFENIDIERLTELCIQR